jgi:hypothetical protein
LQSNDDKLALATAQKGRVKRCQTENANADTVKTRPSGNGMPAIAPAVSDEDSGSTRHLKDANCQLYAGREI